MARFRDRIGVKYDEKSKPYGENLLSKIVACPWCLSIWIAVVLYLLPIEIATILALSMGGVIVLKLGLK